MSSRPERPRRAAAARLARLCLVAAGVTLAAGTAGCGKSDLPRAASSPPPQRRPHDPHHTRAPATASLPPTRALAASFSQAVTLTAADLPGTSVQPRRKTPRAREEEASKCGGRTARTLGGGQSPSFSRGLGLDHESISSSVEVLSSATAARSDLAYVASSAGLACYAKVLRRTVAGEGHGGVRLLGVQAKRIREAGGAGGQAGAGIRIVARVGIAARSVSVPLYVDALSFAYGPAEIDLYSTSFVQPLAVRTRQELLTLLRERARLHPL